MWWLVPLRKRRRMGRKVFFKEKKKNKYYFNYNIFGGDDILNSGYTAASTWKGLTKAWKGFNIAKAQKDWYNMRKYAVIIQKFEKELGEDIRDFTNIIHETEEDLLMEES